MKEWMRSPVVLLPLKMLAEMRMSSHSESTRLVVCSDSSPPASMSCVEGHSLENLAFTNKHLNMWKAAYFWSYTIDSFVERAMGTDLAERMWYKLADDATFDDFFGAVVWHHTCTFL